MELLWGLPDIFILTGILIIVIGFALKLDTIFVVIAAAFATAVIAKIPIIEFLQNLGSNFVDQRLMTVFILSLPVIGLLEKYGLREISADFISKIKRASGHAILSLYLIIRLIAGALGLRLGGHVQFVRPLVYPMARAAVETKGKLTDKEDEKLKALSCAVENFGNFYGQNVFLAAGGVLLITGTLAALGYEVEAADVALASIPIAVITAIVGVIYLYISTPKGGK